MRPNARQLAMREAERDPALASLFGINVDEERQAPVRSAAQSGSSFGNEYYGYGGDFGYEFGADGPAAMAPAAGGGIPVTHPAHPLHPAQHANTMAVLNEHHQAKARTAHREMLLDPNKGSATKVERYSFAISVANDTGGNALTFGGFTPGQSQTFSASNQPSVTIRPQRFVSNSPAAGVFLYSTLQVANVNALVGDIEDGWNFSAQSVGVHLDLPTMSPANKVTVGGTMQSYTPPGVSTGQTYTLVSSFSGPATLAG